MYKLLLSASLVTAPLMATGAEAPVEQDQSLASGIVEHVGQAIGTGIAEGLEQVMSLDELVIREYLAHHDLEITDADIQAYQKWEARVKASFLRSLEEGTEEVCDEDGDEEDTPEEALKRAQIMIGYGLMIEDAIHRYGGKVKVPTGDAQGMVEAVARVMAELDHDCEWTIVRCEGVFTFMQTLQDAGKLPAGAELGDADDLDGPGYADVPEGACLTPPWKRA